jgi:WS/DGAT/MGAT family acyltransferase
MAEAPTLRHRMTSTDAGFLYLERPHALLHIGCVAVLEGPVCLDALARHVDARLPRLVRYTQRAVPVPFSLGHPTWEDDPNFDLRAHLFRWSLPRPGGEHELREAVAQLLARPLDRSRPLWEFHLLEGLDGGRSALFQKVHHCMVDGVSGAQLLEALLDPAPSPFPRAALRLATAPADVPGAVARISSAVGDDVRRGARSALGFLSALRRPAIARDAARRLLDAAWSAVQLTASDVPELPWNASIGPRRVLQFSRLPLADVQRIRKLRGGTVNDVVLTVLAGGLQRYLRAIGVQTRGLEAVALVPVSLRKPDESGTLGNRISALLVPLAVDPESEPARLESQRAMMDRLKENSAWAGIDSLLTALDDVPAPLVAMFGASLSIGRIANLIATNVPGPRETRFLGPHRAQALYPIVPIIDGIGLGLAVFSYDGWLHVGLNADPDLVPDLEKLRQGVEEGFSHLLGSS